MTCSLSISLEGNRIPVFGNEGEKVPFKSPKEDFLILEVQAVIAMEDFSVRIILAIEKASVGGEYHQMCALFPACLLSIQKGKWNPCGANRPQRMQHGRKDFRVRKPMQQE